jgi:hypothetical protein
MKERLIWSVFWALVVVFVVAVCAFVIPAFRESIMDLLFMAVFGVLLCALGIALIVLAVKQKVGGLFKKFLLLTGASAIGIPVGILLHNAVYGLFIYFFGADFWNGGDEPFFFIIGLIVCPLGFIVGVVGSIVLNVRRRRQPSVS